MEKLFAVVWIVSGAASSCFGNNVHEAYTDVSNHVIFLTKEDCEHERETNPDYKDENDWKYSCSELRLRASDARNLSDEITKAAKEIVEKAQTTNAVKETDEKTPK
jgi:hypothetical protein